MDTFVRFCFASAYRLQEDLRLPTEKLICLYKECIGMAKHCNDMDTMVCSCMEFVFHSNSIGRHADSLRCLKEILPSAVVMPSYELIVHRYLSLTYNELNEFDNVVLHAKKWIEIARNIGDKENEIYGHYIMGYAFSFLACYDDAIDCGKKTLEIAQETDSARGEMMAYDQIRVAYKFMRKHDDTILYAHKLLDCAIKTNDQKDMMTAYSELGREHLALEHYQDDAISICNKCDHIDQEDDEDKAFDVIAYCTLGRVNQSLEQYDEAIQYFKQCIDIANRIGREKKPAVRACLCLGEIYQTLQQHNDAVYYCKKCIDVAQKTGEKSFEAKACLLLLISYGQILDEKDNAIQYGKKCLNLCQETNDKKTQITGHYLLAQVYIGLKQLNDVSLNIDAGMAIATELGDKVTEEAEEKFKFIRSSLYANVGLLGQVKGFDLPGPIKKLFEVPTSSEDDVLQDLAQAVKTGDKIKKRMASIRLYIFYLHKNDYQKAIDSIEQLKEMDMDCSTNLYCFMHIGNVYQLIGQTDMALRCFKEGLSTAESCSDNMLRSKFYHGIGKLLFSLNKELNLAERYLREAIRCFEAIFTTLGSRDEFKISIFDKYIHTYKLLASLLIKGEQMEEALLVLDRCRARALEDLMISNYKMEQEASNDEHLEYGDVLSLVSRNDFSISYYSICEGDIFLKFFLGRESNLHFSVCLNHSLQIHVDTLFDEMGVREVVNCENRSLDKEQDIQKEQKRSEEEYEVLNQPTASLFNLNSKRGESNENSAETKGSTLEVLFGILGCDKILSSKQDEVVVIPEGPLYKVPFPALRNPRTGKYLSETKRIRLAPSLATLKHFEDFPTDRTSNAEPLIIGDPLVGKVMMDGVEQDIELLPGARGEAAEISVLLNTPALLTIHATKPAVIKRLQEGVSVVHIAAHGILSKATIVLAPPPEIRATRIPDEEDYMLTMAEVQQAKVRAQLVVLSCCHSGRGEIRAEGVVGMCRAFLASGARAVVASLWAIDDDATFEFMQKFYLSLKDGKSASASLHQAMKEMRNTTSYSKPKYWAPFFLMGDDVTIMF